MTWPIVHGEAISLPETLLPSRGPGGSLNVPMAVQEIRANRFVSLQAGGTAKPELPKPSKEQPRWLPLLVRPARKDEVLPELRVKLEELGAALERSVQRSDPTSS